MAKNKELHKNIFNKIKEESNLNPVNLMSAGDYNQLSTPPGQELYQMCIQTNDLEDKMRNMWLQSKKKVEPYVIKYMSEVGNQINNFLVKQNLNSVKFDPYWEVEPIIEDFSQTGGYVLGSNATVAVQAGIRPWGMGLKWTIYNYTFFMYYGPMTESEFNNTADLYEYPSTICYQTFGPDDNIPESLNWNNPSFDKGEMTKQDNWLECFTQIISNTVVDSDLTTALDVLSWSKEEKNALDDLLEF